MSTSNKPSLLVSSEVARRLDEERDADLSSSFAENASNTASGYSSSTNMVTPPEIASNESRNVFRARVVVIMILAFVAAGISAGVYIITTQSQESEFDAQWEGNSLQIVNSFEEIVKEKFGALSTLAVSFTSYARGNNLTWPFVTMNDFQQRAAIARKISNAIHTQITPIVTPENREKWEEYSVQNKGWIDERTEYEQVIGQDEELKQFLTPALPYSNDPALNFSSGISDKIYSLDTTTFLPVSLYSPPPYYPIWQQSPISHATVVNWNLREFPSIGPFMDVCSEKGEIVVGGFDSYPAGNVSSPNAYSRWFAFLLSYQAGKVVEYTGEPITQIYIPVFDSYDEDHQVVAVIHASINWKSYFANIMPGNVRPIVLVLANSCQGAVTYIIDGPQVKFVGAGDFHSGAMEGYVRHVELKDLLSESINEVWLNQDICQYNLTVYPTPEMYNEYNTRK